MTIPYLIKMLLQLRGGPRIVIQEPMLSEHPPVLTICAHRKHLSRVMALDWERMLPAFLQVQFSAKSHEWLRANSGTESTVTYWRGCS